MKIRRKHILIIFLAGLVVCCGTFFLRAQNQYEESYLLPPEPVQDILTRDRHYDVLDFLSPDGDHFLVPVRSYFSSLELMAQKTYRLAMLEFCPKVNREWRLSTYGIERLKIYSLKQRKSWEVELPLGIFVSDMTWSPDGKEIAFLAHLEKGSRVWVADVETGKTEPMSEAYVMANLAGRPSWRRPLTAASRLLQWTPDGSVITLLVPEDRGPEPQGNPIPSAPIIRSTREKPNPTRTYPFLLRTPLDKELFRYYNTAQMALLTPGKAPQKIGQPGMYLEFFLSPDGNYILAEKVVEPLSYIVSYRDFPRKLQVMNREGKILSTIRHIPLQETAVRGRGQRAEEDLPREVAWRPDGKGLTFLWKEKKKEEEKDEESGAQEAERKDRLMFLAPPFDMEEAKTLVSAEEAFSEVSYSPEGGYAFATLTETQGKGKTQHIAAFDLTGKKPRRYDLVKDIDPEDAVNLPGEIVTRRTGNGILYAFLSPDKQAVYLKGEGYKENFMPCPFMDKVEIKTGKKLRVFESPEQFYDRPLIPLDRDINRMIISRESLNLFPQSYLWKENGDLELLTQNQDPFPEVGDCRRIDFEFTRRDGVTIQARITLPVDYQEGTEVPAVFWAYPQEFKSEKDYQRAAIRRRNHKAFPHLNYRNASEIWLTRGYAVVEPDIPIIGKGKEYNNNYVAHLVDSMHAAIRKVDKMGYVDVDRIGVGGHSYGAFMTANLLAHSPFFKAGIAGDGAYNRTLTPFTFQNEQRFLWEAQDLYLEMSPFFYADHIDTPLLMYHGAQDNNSGTYLIQSERLIHALTGLGKEAVLYIYPFESHGPRCRETYMDLWARWLEWFDTYVKNPRLEEE
ncbi:MAG: S9 family peptidase [Candidatus Aminicenantes bacterium]